MISRCRACYRAGEGNAKLMKKKKKNRLVINCVKNPGMVSRHPLATPGSFSPIPPKKCLFNAFLPLIRLLHLIIVCF